MSEKINVRGVYFDNVNFDEAMEKVKELVKSEGTSVMFTPNSEIVQSCIENNELYKVINSADLVIPDGIGVVKGAQLSGTPLKQKVAGCDLAWNMLAEMEKKGAEY